MEYYVWPRMDLSTAEKRFQDVTLTTGPKPDLDVSGFDISGIGTRMNEKQLLDLRNTLVSVAKPYGFNVRHGFQQDADPTEEAREKLDLEYTKIFRDLTPMRWAEAGSREVWSWFALALLPDLTHWRWKFASAKSWYRVRWIGSDLTRHTWARLWWRSSSFDEAPQLLEQLNEHDFNHLVERANTIGANPRLMTSFARRLVQLNEEYGGAGGVGRRDIFDESAKRMLRRMAFVDDSSLEPHEIDSLVDEFIDETKQMLGVAEQP